MVIEDENAAKRKEAEKEWQALLEEDSRRVRERIEELRQKGMECSLDGENYFKDIDEWFDKQYKAIKKKYGIK